MEKRKRIVFLGDSLTEWFDWTGYFPEHEVLNLGVSGERVEELLDRLDRIHARIDEPDILFIMTGINNIAMDDYEITGYYRAVIERLTSWYPRTMIVIQSLLPVDLHWIDNGIINGLNLSLQGIADAFKTEYLNVYSHFVNQEGRLIPSYLLDDGVHISDEGYSVWASVVAAYLAALRERPECPPA
jgi:lysophospholipase L1-like esterase